jgi:outer membrane receptor protein involved in Fe transport
LKQHGTWFIRTGTVNTKKSPIDMSLGMTDYEPFITSDIKIRWRKAGWVVYGAVNNIVNIEYYDYGNVPQPGRWIKAGISKTIGF